jgi:2-oxoglutarate dehydrogenase E2 component (dihydrolipoamide succinyltransferase)
LGVERQGEEMKVEIVMPKMGESINEGTLIKWHKKKGDKVKKDEIIYEISTDKVDTEIPSPEDGVLININVFEQETVEVGTVVAVLETESENVVIQNEKVNEEIPSTKQVGGDIVDVPMPKMGESVMEGTIIKWYKKVGDAVKRDEIIFEISTDKVDTEVPSPVDGIVSQILFKENDTVQVGLAVAKILTSTGIAKPKPVSVEQVQQTDSIKKENVPEMQLPITNNQSLIKKHKSSVRFYSPLVLNIARTEGIALAELELIQGTGIGGRVSKNDVLNYLQIKRSGKSYAQIIPDEKDQLRKEEKFEQLKSEGVDRIKIIPMDNIRQRIMFHMINSKNTSVHVTAINEIDMSKIHNFIEKNRAQFLQKEGLKLTYMAFIAYAAIKGLKEYPLMNASIEGNNIIVKNYINLGIAVAVDPNGLIVPNIKNADEKNIIGLAKSIADLGSRSRTKKLIPDDIVDGTFSITNYGVFGSLFGTPIINQPEVGILGVGAVTKKPVVIEAGGTESIAIKPMMYLSLSHDHRLVDGMLGGKFLKSVKDTLENFDTNIV